MTVLKLKLIFYHNKITLKINKIMWFITYNT